MNERHLLITGGAGFVGSAAVRRAVKSGHTVLNVDKLTYAGNLTTVAEIANQPNYRFSQTDIADRAAIRGLIEAFRPSTILHLAAESHVDRSIDAPAAFIETNITGTFVLLEEARRFWMTLEGDHARRFRFVHVSTDEVFGSLGREGRFNEATPYNPSSPYSSSKAGSDHLVRAWHHTYGLPVIVTNCCNNYGPYQYPEKLIPLLIDRALAGKSLPLYGDGQQVRDWLFVEDHAEALLKAAESGSPGETYLIGGRAERTNLAVARAICRLLDGLDPEGSVPSKREGMIAFVKDRPGHDFRYAIDPSKAERELGWSAKESFETGLRKTIRWYVDNADWSAKVRKGTYGGERLGLGPTNRIG